jgi:hypothetical protein
MPDRCARAGDESVKGDEQKEAHRSVSGAMKRLKRNGPMEASTSMAMALGRCVAKVFWPKIF